MFVANRPLVPAAACALMLALASPSFATVPADLCTGNPCTVSGAKTITPPAVLDFGATTDLVFSGTAVVTIGAGAVARRADPGALDHAPGRRPDPRRG